MVAAATSERVREECVPGRGTGLTGSRSLVDTGVLQAKANVDGPIANIVTGMDVTAQSDIDAAMIEADGTPNKAQFGSS